MTKKQIIYIEFTMGELEFFRDKTYNLFNAMEIYADIKTKEVSI